MASNLALTTRTELLHRQAHPTHVIDGIPSSALFRPTPKDDGQLSVDRASVHTAEESHALHTAKGFASVAVWSLAVSEYLLAHAPPYADPLPDNAAHCYADFSAMSRGERERAAKLLKEKAITTGSHFAP